MNQAVVLCLLSIVAIESQVFIPAPQKFSLQYSPFMNYLQPQTYFHHLNSLPPNQLSYIVPAHASLINSPLKTLSVFPNLYRDSRAICSLCSCASDYGCAYNCHKCPALCYTCDCSLSLGCRYNCDKCQEKAGGDTQETKPPPTSNTGVESVGIPAGCEGLQAESELCTWGQICQTIKNAQFPNCDYDCNTCKFSSSNDKDDQDEDVPNKPSTEDDNKITDSCSILENELRLCTWGPSCQTIKDAQYPECNYNCATCELESAGQTDEASPPLVSPIVADPNWGNGQNQQNENWVPDVQDLDVWKPKPEAVEAEKETDDIPDECYKLENEIDLCSWGPSCQLVKDSEFPQCNYNCANCKLDSTASKNDEREESLSESHKPEPGAGSVTDENEEIAPSTAASVAEEQLISLWEEFNPSNSFGSVVSEVENSAWGQTLHEPQIAAIEADTDDSVEEDESADGFTWADFDSSESKTCLAVSGPGAGKKCKFPFIHQGVTYKSCALLIKSHKEKSSSDSSIGWCSTKVDINRYHITGPSDDKWHNVGFCDKSCVTKK